MAVIRLPKKVMKTDNPNVDDETEESNTAPTGNALLEFCRRFVSHPVVPLFCLSRTLSFKDVLEFSTTGKEKLDVEKKAFVA
jgi:hypothetical protein